MSRKDFELIARVISAHLSDPTLAVDEGVAQRDRASDLIERMALALSTTNANFNFATFRKACQ